MTTTNQAEYETSETPDEVTCPNCGHTGPEFGNGFSWLAAGLNGIESGSADDVELLECGQCEHRFDPDLSPAQRVDGTGYAEALTIYNLRHASTLLEEEEDGSVFLPSWDGADGERERMIRSAARAVLSHDGIEGGTRTTKRALAALVHYVADMLEE
jgi:hypothetical protein